MSYAKKIEYRIKPAKSYEIRRNCSGCGCKTVFHNTDCFRVNANGNKVDVWLIYQCSKCKHTYNLTIYERQKPDCISSREFEDFQHNSPELAFRYGTDVSLFNRNKAEIAWEQADYELEAVSSEEKNPLLLTGDCIVIHNDSGIKIRTDKIIAEILSLSRSRLKQYMDNKTLLVTEKKQEKEIEILIQENLSAGQL